MSFFVSAVTGYMAGLIWFFKQSALRHGILVVMGRRVVLVAGIEAAPRQDADKALIAFALFTTAVIFCVAAIANNNSGPQDRSTR
jgi:uncharacterized oligopeptide transporter (OPT) family protein